MRKITCVAFVALVLCAGAGLVSAKGSPDRIVITDGGLAQPIKIIDRDTLKQFDP
jgi:G3E family GTPase